MILTINSDQFTEWIECCTFSIGYCRYGQLGGHGFVCVSSFDCDYHELVDDLSGGDIEAIHAAGVLAASKSAWIGKGKNPADAAKDCLEKMLCEYKKMNGV